MSSSVRRELEGFVAGRVRAEQLVIAVTAVYYRDGGDGMRDALRPLIEVIDRAAPGVVELTSTGGGSGFGIHLAERAFPAQYEAELRRAAEVVLSRCEMRDAGWVDRIGTTHLASRIPHLVSWIRRLFRGSPSA